MPALFMDNLINKKVRELLTLLEYVRDYQIEREGNELEAEMLRDLKKQLRFFLLLFED